MAHPVAYGFIGLEQVFNERVKKIDQGLIDTAIQQSLEEQERQVESLMTWAQRTTKRSDLVRLAGSGELQDIDEWGNPLPVKDAAPYEVGYPIKFAGDAWGWNRIVRAKMTVEEVNRKMIATMNKDAKWIRRNLLSAIFTNTSYTHADGRDTAVTVYPLANGDSVTYTTEGSEVEATHNHYVAQAAAIADLTNPYETIYNHLLEHPSNNPPFVAYIPTNLKQTTLDLTNFVPVSDADVILGANSSRVRDMDESEMARIAGPGGEILGRVDKVWVVEWKTLPNDYIIGVAAGNVEPFMVMREDEDYNGLVREDHDVDGNRQEIRYIRYAGFAIRDRVAAVVVRVNNGSYAIPTNYTATY